MKKPSEIFEGKNSSLRKAFDRINEEKQVELIQKNRINPKMCWGTDCDEDRCRCHDDEEEEETKIPTTKWGFRS